ncbi:MAG: BRCT domain-containing protein [Methanothrix sp.]|nr:BRCT domain-containing protein [Methanothrix sp.]
MISNSDKISRREEINEVLEQLGQVLEHKVEALLIGGAVMLELGLKDATKDIDVVCRSEEDKERLLAAAKALGFEIVGPEKRHERLGIKRLAVKGGRNLDVFAERISYDFDLSEAMWQRATRIRSFGMLVIRDASLEDIFIMKLIANRPGDAPDCSNLVMAGLDYDAVYREIEAQYRKAGEAKEKIWINYIEEGIARLQDKDLTIPIGDKISLLASEYHEKGKMRGRF